MIEFSNVSKIYPDGTSAVHSLDFTIQEGEFFVLIGPSGCGKTTTLKMMNRLIDASSGTIMIDQKKISEYDIHELRFNIGYVLQQIALFPHMTIEENIAIVPELKKWKNDHIQNRVSDLLETVGLDPDIYRNRKPKELSGGQQQRIGVARALAADPKLILMDEPFSALDPISREKLQDDLLELKRSIHKTIVFVTHDMKEALKLGDRICVMNEGEIVQIGSPQELIQAPVNEFVQNFVGVQKNLTYINLEQLAKEIAGNYDSLPFPMVSSSVSLKQTLDLLTEHDQLIVKKDDEVIGMVDRQAIVRYIAENLEERGLVHE
jgi:osmoprotectant transport system ATP-binding protein